LEADDPAADDAGRPDAARFCGFDDKHCYTLLDDSKMHDGGRIEARNGKRKQFVPLIYGVLDGARGWHKKTPDPPPPLYGLNKLTAMPDAIVVLCEGEKAAHREEIGGHELYLYFLHDFRGFLDVPPSPVTQGKHRCQIASLDHRFMNGSNFLEPTGLLDCARCFIFRISLGVSFLAAIPIPPKESLRRSVSQGSRFVCTPALASLALPTSYPLVHPPASHYRQEAPRYAVKRYA